MSRVRIDATECPQCRDRGGVIAEIRTGAHEGRWFFATGFQQRGGDCWGSWGCLNASGKSFPTQDEARAGAVDQLRQKWVGREHLMAVQLAWLENLAPAQPDLFAIPQERAA